MTVYQISEQSRDVEERNAPDKVAVVEQELKKNQVNTNSNVQIATTSLENNTTKVATTNSATMTADEKYKVFLNGLKNSLSTYNKGGDNVLDIVDSGTYYDTFWIESWELKNNGDVYLNISETSNLGKKFGTHYKLASNVIKVGTYFDEDEGGVYPSTNYIYIINEEGKFYYCDVTEGSTLATLELKENTKIKNIVSIEEWFYADHRGAVAIDIEGKIYDPGILFN